MENFKSIDQILEFAITAEQDAIEFYSGLYKRTNNINMKAAYKEFILEEKSHKVKLQNLKAKGVLSNMDNAKITDLKIADYISEQEPHENMDYSESLVVAMQKEKAAFKLYTDLAEIAEEEEIRKTFLFLAAEEAKHKLKFEIEYDDNVLRDN